MHLPGRSGAFMMYRVLDDNGCFRFVAEMKVGEETLAAWGWSPEEASDAWRIRYGMPTPDDILRLTEGLAA